MGKNNLIALVLDAGRRYQTFKIEIFLCKKYKQFQILCLRNKEDIIWFKILNESQILSIANTLCYIQENKYV